jgi:hypothetical protein
MDSPESTTPGPRSASAPERQRAIELARERREAIRLRARRIRRSVGALTATLFSVAFLVIYVQLASGHDPALVANAKRTSTAKTANHGSVTTAASKESDSSSGTSRTSTGSASSTTSSTPSTSEESTESTESSASEESSSGASAVTTSQS